MTPPCGPVMKVTCCAVASVGEISAAATAKELSVYLIFEGICYSK